MATVNAKEFMQRAYEYIVGGWTQSKYYAFEDDEEIEDESNLLLNHRERIRFVCSVGAMRVAFADLVGVPVSVRVLANGDKEEYVEDQQALQDHPFYKEGMKILGKAFHEFELWAERLDEDNFDKLLNGEGGRPHTVPDVEQSVIEANDMSGTTFEEIRQVFERAVELAPEDLTTETLPPPHDPQEQ